MVRRSSSRTRSKSPARKAVSLLTAKDEATLKQLEESIVETHKEEAYARDHVSLLRHPVMTLQGFLWEVVYFGGRVAQYFASNLWVLALVMSLVIGFLVAERIPGSHQYAVDVLYDEAWWIFLGFLSSFGLGTGLHTFVLYLGPFIAETTLAAYDCGHTNFATLGDNKFICETVARTGVSLLPVLWKVQRQAIAWGVGTAIGELPPYFVARAARLSGDRTAETAEVEELLEKKAVSFKDRITQRSLQLLQRLGFLGIMLFASIPNPLFDLAGLMSGHLLIPFATFFGATAIGKGLIKVHIQSVFVIFIFSQHHLEKLISMVETVVPSLRAPLDAFVLKQKSKFHGAAGGVAAVATESMFSQVWSWVLTIMIGYFAISIVNSTARAYLVGRAQTKLKQLEADKQALLARGLKRSKAADLDE